MTAAIMTAATVLLLMTAGSLVSASTKKQFGILQKLMHRPDVEKAIRDRVKDGTGNLYVLVNYTALFATRNILKKLEGEQK